MFNVVYLLLHYYYPSHSLYISLACPWLSSILLDYPVRLLLMAHVLFATVAVALYLLSSSIGYCVVASGSSLPSLPHQVSYLSVSPIINCLSGSGLEAGVSDAYYYWCIIAMVYYILVPDDSLTIMLVRFRFWYCSSLFFGSACLSPFSNYSALFQ